MGQQLSGSFRIDRYSIICSDLYGSFREDRSVDPNFKRGTFSNSGYLTMESDAQDRIFCVMESPCQKWRGTLFILNGFNEPFETGTFVVNIDGQPHQGRCFCSRNPRAGTNEGTNEGTYEVQHTFPLYMEKSWREALREELLKPYFLKIDDILLSEREKVCPELEDIYAWTQACPIDKVKVVILGEDPYKKKVMAHGLAFSMKPGNPPSVSLDRIYEELKLEGFLPWGTKLNHGYLMSWAKQGVLLLNTWLTVKQGSKSIIDEGWQTFTDAVIQHLSETMTELVFILWGNPAIKKESLINEVSKLNPDGSHLILRGTHPSPKGIINAETDFLSYDTLPSGQRVRNGAHQYFRECNVFLKSCNKTEINWASLLEERIEKEEENNT